MARKTKDNPLGLDPFEGEAVTELGLEIPSAGGGFHRPLEVDQTLLDVLAPVTAGDTVYAVLQLVKRDVKMKRAKDHDGWKRVDIFQVDGAAIVDPDFALGAIVEQRQRVQEAIDAASGQGTMVTPGGFHERRVVPEAEDVQVGEGRVEPVEDRTRAVGEGEEHRGSVPRPKGSPCCEPEAESVDVVRAVVVAVEESAGVGVEAARGGTATCRVHPLAHAREKNQCEKKEIK